MDKGSGYGVKEVAEIIFINLDTGKPELFLDALKMSNLTNEGQTVFINGGQGSQRLLGWDFGRTSEMTMQDALLNPKAISVAMGTNLTVGVANVYNREVLTAVDNAAVIQVTLSETPILKGTPAEDIDGVYKTTDGYEHTTEILPASYSVAAKVITLSAGVAAGEKVIVYYEYATAATAQTVTIDADKFSAYYKVIGTTVVRNLNGTDEPFQIIIPKAKFKPGFNITLDAENPSVFDFGLDIFKAPNEQVMVKMVKY